ncbi:hypothetical protein D3C87_2045530 [compost metagenome]
MPPMMRVEVMQAKVSWKTTNTISGSSKPAEKVAARESSVTPLRKNFERSPTKAERPPSVGPAKASE